MLEEEATRRELFCSLARLSVLDGDVFREALLRVHAGWRPEAMIAVDDLRCTLVVPDGLADRRALRNGMRLLATQALLESVVALPTTAGRVRKDTQSLLPLRILRTRLPSIALEPAQSFLCADLGALTVPLKHVLQHGYSPGAHPIFARAWDSSLVSAEARRLAEIYHLALEAHGRVLRVIESALVVHARLIESIPLVTRSAITISAWRLVARMIRGG